MVAVVGREQSGGPVATVDVEPRVVFDTGVRHLVERIEGAGHRGAGGGDDGQRGTPLGHRGGHGDPQGAGVHGAVVVGGHLHHGIGADTQHGYRLARPVVARLRHEDRQRLGVGPGPDEVGLKPVPGQLQGVQQGDRSTRAEHSRREAGWHFVRPRGGKAG